MSTRYKQVAGGTPDADEQHDPRTFERNQERLQDPPSDLYMMSEIADGVFVQWLKCHTCGKNVGECGCKGGPAEAPWLASSRETRMEHSFGRRGAKPPLPEALKQRDRTINAVMQELIEKGYTITPPAKKVEVKAPVVPTTDEAFEVVATATAEVAADGEVRVTVEEADAEWNDAVQAGVQNGVNEALERARARAAEETDDVGF
jgi:hypothetical protein